MHALIVCGCTLLDKIYASDHNSCVCATQNDAHVLSSYRSDTKTMIMFFVPVCYATTTIFFCCSCVRWWRRSCSLVIFRQKYRSVCVTHLLMCVSNKATTTLIFCFFCMRQDDYAQLFLFVCDLTTTLLFSCWTLPTAVPHILFVSVLTTIRRSCFVPYVGAVRMTLMFCSFGNCSIAVRLCAAIPTWWRP